MSFVTILLFVTVVTSFVTAVPISKEVTFNPTRENQIDFDLKQLSGLWYTIWKSKEFVQDDSVHIKPKVFYSNTKGSISFVEINVRDNKFCVAGETEKSHVYATEKNVPVEVISTNYNSTALFRYCTNVTDSTCHPNHYYYEIASRTPTMEPDDEIRILTEIYRVSGRYEEMTYLGADCEGGNVIFDTIPVTASFSLNNILGDFFALAQTDFTGIKPLLAHNIYLPHPDLVAGWFTMINREQNTCSPVMQSMTKVNPSNNGILYSKLGDFQSKKRWSVSKTLYSDKHYTLSYFCFEKFNRSCSRDKTEVRLDSRQKDIDPDFKRTLFQLLQKVCLTADSMKDIEYNIDCSSHLKEGVNKKQKLVKEFASYWCRKEKMVVADYNTKEKKLDGIWYAVAYINGVYGYAINITTFPRFTIIDHCRPANNVCTWLAVNKLIQTCSGKAKFLEMIHRSRNDNYGRMYVPRFAYIDKQMYIAYTCLEESEGMCKANLTQVIVYTRENKPITDSNMKKVKNILSHLCFDISQLTMLKHPSFTFQEIPNFLNHTETSCSMNNIPFIEDMSHSKLLGTWYELAHSNISGHIGKGKHTHRLQFTMDVEGYLNLNYQYDDNKVNTSDAFVGTIQPQCSDSHSGYFVKKVTLYTSAVRFLYTNYENFAIIYVCSNIYHNGECFEPMVYIIGRKPKLTTHILSVAELILEKACIRFADMQIVEGVFNCASSLTGVNNTVNKHIKISVCGICRKEKMVIADYNTKEKKLDGIWYAVASINTPAGFVSNVTTLPGFLIADHCLPSDNICQWIIRYKLIQTCSGKAKFLESTFYKSGSNSSYLYETQLAYIDEQIHISYSCLHESDGMCNYTQVIVYSKEKQLTYSNKEKVKDILPRLCLDISQLKIATFSSFSFSKPHNFVNYTQTPCSLENIPYIENVDYSKLLGTWYELAHSKISGYIGKGKHTHRLQFTMDAEGYLNLNYQYDDNKVYTSGAFVGTIQPQYSDSHSGYFVKKVTFYTIVVKILYTDYKTFTIIYGCSGVYKNGICNQPMVHIIGRKPKLTLSMLRTAGTIFNDFCIRPNDILILTNVSTSEVKHPCKTVKSNDWKSILEKEEHGMQGDEGKKEQEEEEEKKEDEEEKKEDEEEEKEDEEEERKEKKEDKEEEEKEKKEDEEEENEEEEEEKEKKEDEEEEEEEKKEEEEENEQDEEEREQEKEEDEEEREAEENEQEEEEREQEEEEREEKKEEENDD